MQNRTLAFMFCLLVVLYPPTIGITSQAMRLKETKIKVPSRTDSLVTKLNEAQERLKKSNEILKRQQDTIKRIKE